MIQFAGHWMHVLVYTLRTTLSHVFMAWNGQSWLHKTSTIIHIRSKLTRESLFHFCQLEGGELKNEVLQPPSPQNNNNKKPKVPQKPSADWKVTNHTLKVKHCLRLSRLETKFLKLREKQKNQQNKTAAPTYLSEPFQQHSNLSKMQSFS